MEQDDSVDGIPKLGIVAACQLDGSVSFYAVPHPKDIRQKIGAPEGQTIYCKSSVAYE
jgi:transcription factor C subunit 6